MIQFFGNIKAFLNRRSVKYALPFTVLMVGSLLGLKQFAQLRYTYRKINALTKEDIEREGIEITKTVSLETEYEKIKEMDIEHWENIRGPRPWEKETLQQIPAK